MTSINEIFRTFGPEYLERYANLMPKTHLKVIDDYLPHRNCGLALPVRTVRPIGLSPCGNRHCPTC
jgi:hypothetical protein